MFYDIFKELCQQRGISPSRAAAEIGLSNATVTKWKKSGASPSGATLTRVASYFEVSADTLLGQPAAQPALTPDDFTYALYGEAKNLNDENKQKLLEMARYLLHTQEQAGE